MNERDTSAYSFEEDRYRPLLAVQGRSPTLRRIWRRAYGSEYPEAVEPLGFITLPALHRVAKLLAVGAGQAFVDLGCGRGGPGLWVARHTGASLIGVDIVAEAIDQARSRARAFDVENQATFHVGTFAATGLPSDSVDGALSIDSLWMVLDKPAAMDEVARVLVRGGRWVITTWEPPYLRNSDLLEAHGFDVVVEEEPTNWKEPQIAVYEGILASEQQLIAELGPEGAALLVAEALEVSRRLDDYRRLLLAAVLR